MEEISYRKLNAESIEIELFKGFNRYQDVKKCWRKENGEWILKEIAFVEHWDTKDYEYLVKCLKNTTATEGTVYGAFQGNDLVGFASIEGKPFGSEMQYLVLSCIHISYEKRGKGIGRKLFSLICDKAREKGARKLYISGHSSQESQAFYMSLGCSEAKEYNAELVALEPCDCQLEYCLF